MVKIVVRSLGSARAKIATVVVAACALASMCFAAVAGATEPLVEPMVKHAETEFTANLTPILTFIGILVAVTLVVTYFRTHAKKG